MLVLTRKLNETVLIGADVAVTVISIARGVTRLAVHAPAAVPVVRQELLEGRTVAQWDADRKGMRP